MINAKDMKVSVSTAFFGRSVPEVVHYYAEASGYESRAHR